MAVDMDTEGLAWISITVVLSTTFPATDHRHRFKKVIYIFHRQLGVTFYLFIAANECSISLIVVIVIPHPGRKYLVAAACRVTPLHYHRHNYKGNITG